MSDIIGEALGLPAIKPNVTDSVIIQSDNTQIIEPTIFSSNPVEEDYEFARKAIKDSIITAQEALDEMSDLAGQLQHPRAYEVVATLSKSVVDSAKLLLDMSKVKRDITPPSDTTEIQSPSSVTNNLNVTMNTSDLLDWVLEKRKANATNS